MSLVDRVKNILVSPKDDRIAINVDALTGASLRSISDLSPTGRGEGPCLLARL